MHDAALARALDLIYDSAVAPESWPAALEQLALLFRAGFADLYARTTDRSRESGLAYGLDRADYEDVFLGVWSKRNVWANRHPTATAGEVVATRDFLPKEELVRSEMYNEYLAPRGLHEGLRLAIWSGEGWVQDVSLLRPWSAGPYTRTERALAGALLPHLQRAAGVGRRLREASGPQAAFAGLDAMRHPGFLLGATGRVIRFNRAAEALLAGNDGLSVQEAALTAATAGASARLDAAVASAAGWGGARPRSAAVRLPRPSGLPPLLLDVMPVREQSGCGFLGGPAVLVLVAGAAAEAEALAPRLVARFGLTRAEAGLAVELAAGRSVTEVAECRGRSVNTVRTQLARLMGKLEVRRQAELVRVVAAFAAGPVRTAG